MSVLVTFLLAVTYVPDKTKQSRRVCLHWPTVQEAIVVHHAGERGHWQQELEAALILHPDSGRKMIDARLTQISPFVFNPIF